MAGMGLDRKRFSSSERRPTYFPVPSIIACRRSVPCSCKFLQNGACLFSITATLVQSSSMSAVCSLRAIWVRARIVLCEIPTALPASKPSSGCLERLHQPWLLVPDFAFGCSSRAPNNRRSKVSRLQKSRLARCASCFGLAQKPQQIEKRQASRRPRICAMVQRTSSRCEHSGTPLMSIKSRKSIRMSRSAFASAGDLAAGDRFRSSILLSDNGGGSAAELSVTGRAGNGAVISVS